MKGKRYLSVAIVLLFSTGANARGQWQDACLTTITGGPSVSGEIAMAFDPVWNTMRTHYIASDGHVHELFLSGGMWQDADLTAITGGPNASGGIAMAFDPVWNTMRTHYIAANGHVHELFLSGSRWQDADLTAITGGPSTSGGIAMAFDPAWNTMRTHYIAADRHVHELFLSGTRWQDADLTAMTLGGAPCADDYFPLGQTTIPCASGAIAMAFDPVSNTMRTHYVSVDVHWDSNYRPRYWYHIRQLFLSGGTWQDAHLGGPSPLPQTRIAMAFDPFPYYGMRTHYVIAFDQHVWELFLSGGVLQGRDLTYITGGARASGEIAMSFDPAWNAMRTHYIAAADRHVHELVSYGIVAGGVVYSTRDDSDLTAATGALANGRIAMQFDPVWNGMRTHYFNWNAHVHELFFVP